MSSYLARFLKRLHFKETVKLASPSVLSIPLTLVSVPLCLSYLGSVHGILLILFLLQNQSHIFLFGTEKNRSINRSKTSTADNPASMLIAFVYGGCLVTIAIILVMIFDMFDYLALSTTNFSLLLAGIPVHLLWTVQR